MRRGLALSFLVVAPFLHAFLAAAQTPQNPAQLSFQITGFKSVPSLPI